MTKPALRTNPTIRYFLFYSGILEISVMEKHTMVSTKFNTQIPYERLKLLAGLTLHSAALNYNIFSLTVFTKR